MTASKALFPQFSRLSRQERLQQLHAAGLLTTQDVQLLQQSVAEDILHLSDKFVENVIGCFPLPLGIVPDFPCDERMVVVPMAIEETSVIAAVNKMAKWIRHSGKLSTIAHGHEIIGQIQLPRVKNFTAVKTLVHHHAAEWINLVNQYVVPSLVKRGGGVTRIEVRCVPREEEGEVMAVVHVYMHPCDAMGANLINQVCEFLRTPIEETTGEKVHLCILSNLTDSRLIEAQVVIENIEPQLAENIVEAGYFAQQDPYRAATHNKGVMNGMDAVLIATGNDWRAVEAGVHAYAARSGQYRAITQWKKEGNDLVGQLVAPIVVGTVGGVTRGHPMARLALHLSQIQHATDLARLVAATGLVQNLAAIRALSSEGIVRGHMTLHIKNLLIAVGATKEEQQVLQRQAQQYLKNHHKITESDIQNLLMQWRAQHAAT